MAASLPAATRLAHQSLASHPIRPQIHCLFRAHNVAALITAGSQSQHRYASANASRQKKKDNAAEARKKKARSKFRYEDVKSGEQFSLCDAMRYIRAFEVGRIASSPKYELHCRLRTIKNGPVIRNRMQLPNPVKTDLRVAVICPPDSKAAEDARKAGASIVGEDVIFDAVKAGNVDFDRCICHSDSLQKLAKAGIARILGPRGLMPSAKLGTVVKDVATSVRTMTGGSEYRERMGTIQLAIGQLAHSPEEVQQNIRAFMEQLAKDRAALADRCNKDIHEIVLSSTNSPGFSLNGEFKDLSDEGTGSQQLVELS